MHSIRRGHSAFTGVAGVVRRIYHAVVRVCRTGAILSILLARRALRFVAAATAILSARLAFCGENLFAKHFVCAELCVALAASYVASVAASPVAVFGLRFFTEPLAALCPYRFQFFFDVHDFSILRDIVYYSFLCGVYFFTNFVEKYIIKGL